MKRGSSKVPTWFFLIINILVFINTVGIYYLIHIVFIVIYLFF